MTSDSPWAYRLLPICLALCLATSTGGMWAALLVGRALPWQATRLWILVFSIAFTLSGLWSWRFYHEIHDIAEKGRPRLVAALWGGSPMFAVSSVVLVLLYSSEELYRLALREDWRMQIVAGVATLIVIAESSRPALVSRLKDTEIGLGTTMRDALSSRSVPVGVTCLCAIGILQAAASVTPIGDDIWHYTEVADALLGGLPYPIHTVTQEYRDAGMTAYPALPVLPALLALAFTVLGRNLIGVTLPIAAATALFPLAFFVACRRLTNSSLVAYATSVSLFLFPVYQIHMLGVPEPDTVFVVLLLAGAAEGIAANQHLRQRHWLATGIFMGLAALTRPEGVAYSIVLYAILWCFHQSKKDVGLSLATWLTILAPFAILHYSITRSIWPTTFAGTLNLRNITANLEMLQGSPLQWYSQATGVESAVLIALVLVGLFLTALGTAVLWRRDRTLVFIPIAGMGNIAAGFLIQPQVMLAYSPVEFLRHLSFGIPYVVLTLGYVATVGLRVLAGEGPSLTRALALTAFLVIASTGLYYETERLARPETYFGGPASLLWVGSSYLLTDIWSHPTPLPDPRDPRTGEQIRADLQRPLEGVNLRRVNRSEPYHWTSLLLALFGLIYASTSPRGIRRQR